MIISRLAIRPTRTPKGDAKMILLTKVRKSAGLSQAKLARLADLHPSTVSNISTGNLKPWAAQRERIEAVMKDVGWDGTGDLFEILTDEEVD
jgi:transcriptional regulator with XRE-family HTH domain